MTYKCIDIADALPLLESCVQIADIRDLVSFQAGHITNAQHLSNENIATYIEENDFDTPVIVCCYHGNSSKNAAEYLASVGFKDVYSLNGGFSQWAIECPKRCEQG